MTTTPLISIIIPVYNGERYLKTCLDSVVRQDYTHWQLLLIDDGSTDGSGAICDAYAAADSRISVVHQANAGHAASRNRGIAMAQGQFVSFIDCDDWIAPDMYTQMVTALTAAQADIIVCGFVCEFTDRQRTVHGDGPQRVVSGQEAMQMVLRNEIGSYLWSMMFRRDTLQEPIALLKAYEDHATIYKWFAHARRVVLLPRAFYHYRQVAGSSLHAYDHKNGNHFFLAIRERYHDVADRRLLPHWTAENRRLYLRGCLKLAKDIARAPGYDAQSAALIAQVRTELRSFMPVTRRELGWHQYLRWRLLCVSIPLFVRVLRLSSVFSFGRRQREQGMFQ